MIKPRKLSKIDLYCEVAGRAKREAQEVERKRRHEAFGIFTKYLDQQGLALARDLAEGMDKLYFHGHPAAVITPTLTDGPQ